MAIFDGTNQICLEDTVDWPEFDLASHSVNFLAANNSETQIMVRSFSGWRITQIKNYWLGQVPAANHSDKELPVKCPKPYTFNPNPNNLMLGLGLGWDIHSPLTTTRRESNLHVPGPH